MKNNEHQIINYFAPGDIYLDIGAHKGVKAQYFIDKEFKSILVEPQPECIKILNTLFKGSEIVEILQFGMGASRDILEMSINTREPALSTFSEEWKTGRFIDSLWDTKIDVPITTLDYLISKYGSPRYIKIDVEGFELEVIKGLTHKSGIISFEFTVEFIRNAIKCISYLSSLGYSKFNLTKGEDLTFFLDKWVNKEDIILKLNKLALNDKEIWGDIYAN